MTKAAYWTVWADKPGCNLHLEPYDGEFFQDRRDLVDGWQIVVGFYNPSTNRIYPFIQDSRVNM